MSPQMLGLAFSFVLPLVAMASAVALLRRAISPEQRTHWFSLCFSGMVFAMSTFWLAKSVGYLRIVFDATQANQLDAWALLNTLHGPYFCVSLLMQTGAFYLYLVWKQRKARR